MALLFSDTFTEASDLTLASHVPDTGTSWTRIWVDGSTPSFTVIAANDDCKGVTANNSGCLYTCDTTYGSADYEVTFTLKASTNIAERPIYICVRLADQENMYAVRLTAAVSGGRLYKKVAGTWTALGSAFTCPAVNSICKLRISGTTLTFYDDGASIQSVTDSDLSSAGKAGLGLGGGAELVTSTDDANSVWIVDDWSVSSLSLSAELGILTETNIVQTSNRLKDKVLSILTSINTLLEFGGIITVVLGILSETDTLLSSSKIKQRSLQQLSETDALLVVSRSKQRTLSNLTEPDTLLSIVSRKSKTISTLTEINNTFSVTGRKTKLLSLLTETDNVITLGSRIVVVLGQLSEQALPQTLNKSHVKTLGQLLEDGNLLPGTQSKIQTIGLLSETNTLLLVTVEGVEVTAHNIFIVLSRNNVLVVPKTNRIYVVPEDTENSESRVYSVPE